MENIPEAITAKEGKDLDLKDAKKYQLSLDKDLFQIEIVKLINKKILLLKEPK